MSELPIYLDHPATTPVDPVVFEAMAPYFSEHFGNPSSAVHVVGRKAREAVAEARDSLRALVGGVGAEVLFTSGTSEANNLLLLGLVRGGLVDSDRREVVTVATEHRAVLEPCRQLEREGLAVRILSVDREGDLDLECLRSAVSEETLVISVMAANNETGTLHDLGAVAEIAHARGAFLHCDAAQALGKVSLHLDDLGIDFLSGSAHKMYGPKGVGALFCRTGEGAQRLAPLTRGGGQELGLRAGTLNVPGIVGFGRAADLARGALVAEGRRLGGLRDRLEEIFEGGEREGVVFWGRGSRWGRLPHLTCVSFRGVHREALLASTPDVAFSAGAACSSEETEPSHVLSALGATRREALEAVRFGLGRFTTQEEIERAGSAVIASVEKLRRLGV